jgi:hypothetical protein
LLRTKIRTPWEIATPLLVRTMLDEGSITDENSSASEYKDKGVSVSRKKPRLENLQKGLCDY